MKIAGTVILFNPDKHIISNIDSYYPSLKNLYVVDNTGKPSEELIAPIKHLENIFYLHDGENKGIASRLNEICFLAIKDGYEWLLTMDQDSLFEKNTFENYLTCIHEFEEKEMVSMFGVGYYGDRNEKGNCYSLQTNQLITSGSIVNLKLFSVIGGFDEALFIDEVDFEYCLRSASKGFRIFQFPNIFLTHKLGELSYHRSFKNNRITPRILHSPFRIYYITRNFLYVQAKYGAVYKADLAFKRKGLVNRLKNNLLYNKRRWEVIKFFLKGILDFKKKKMGKIKAD